MRIIDITKSENSKSSIDIITTGEIAFIMFDITDLKDLELTGKQNASGVYLLIGEKELYVGQADDIDKRLTQHTRDNEKQWITRVIFVTNKDGVVGKDMLNYMERKLIMYFRESGRDVKNAKDGHESDIFLQNQIKSDNLLSHFFDILGLFNIDLMTSEDIDSDGIVEVESHKLSITLEGKTYDLTKGKQVDVYLEFIKDLYELKPEMIEEMVQDGAPSFGSIFGTERAFYANGTSRSKPVMLGGRNVTVYTNFNAETKMKKMQHLKDMYLVRKGNLS